MELSSFKLKKLVIFQEETRKVRKTKNLLRRNFVSSDVFVIFTAVKPREVLLGNSL